MEKSAKREAQKSIKGRWKDGGRSRRIKRRRIEKRIKRNEKNIGGIFERQEKERGRGRQRGKRRNGKTEEER